MNIRDLRYRSISRSERWTTIPTSFSLVDYTTFVKLSISSLLQIPLDVCKDHLARQIANPMPLTICMFHAKYFNLPTQNHHPTLSAIVNLSIKPPPPPPTPTFHASFHNSIPKPISKKPTPKTNPNLSKPTPTAQPHAYLHQLHLRKITRWIPPTSEN